MLNKNGQSLITFIIILPVILIMLGIVIELGLINYHKTKIISVTKTIIANSIEDAKKDDIILLYDKNDIKVDDLVVDSSSGVRIRFITKIDSFLGDIIGKENYVVNIDIKGNKENNKVYYEKG